MTTLARRDADGQRAALALRSAVGAPRIKVPPPKTANPVDLLVDRVRVWTPEKTTG